MKTLFDKVWDAHVVRSAPGEPDLLYVDLHLVHEVTSPQAFAGLRLAGRGVRRPDLTLAVEDHNVPTTPGPVIDPVSRAQLEALRANCAEFGITLYARGMREQGIVHVVAPELGRTRPGMTIVCGDSHTSTHGAFGALAFGIGTSEVEHVLATQTLWQAKPKAMAVEVDGALPDDTTAKDLALAIVRTLGTGGGAGHVVEYRGAAIRALSMSGRMTVCNMSIEAGARAGMIAPDDVTYAWLRARGVHAESDLASDADAVFDTTVRVDASAVRPHVTWGTNPAQAVPIDGVVPDGDAHALRYMGLTPGTAMRDIRVDTVFVGSCTNGRLDDLRAAAEVLRGRRVAQGVRALVVPGSMLVKAQAEAEGLHRVFTDAGFEWRDAGCSMCLGMNPDVLSPGERCASTSNRNYEGRQGPGGRTHLVSPPVAAATAVAGHFATPEDLR